MTESTFKNAAEQQLWSDCFVSLCREFSRPGRMFAEDVKRFIEVADDAVEAFRNRGGGDAGSKREPYHSVSWAAPCPLCSERVELGAELPCWAVPDRTQFRVEHRPDGTHRLVAALILRRVEIEEIDEPTRGCCAEYETGSGMHSDECEQAR